MVGKGNNLVGKYLKVFYDDLSDGVSCKEGKCSNENELSIEINGSIIVPRFRIVRIEIIGGGA